MPEVEIYRKWICIICVIEISGLMLGSMPEVVERLKTGWNPVPYRSSLTFNWLLHRPDPSCGDLDPLGKAARQYALRGKNKSRRLWKLHSQIPLLGSQPRFHLWHLTFSDQISTLSKSRYSHIREIRCIRPYLDFKAASTIATSIVQSKLDYCNSLYSYRPTLFPVKHTSTTVSLVLLLKSKDPKFTHTKALLFSNLYTGSNQSTYRLD